MKKVDKKVKELELENKTFENSELVA